MTLSLTRRADLWTDRTALVDVDADRTLSYAELDDAAETTARRLAAVGVDAGDAVAVLSRNRREHLALLFACRRLGATLAPISHRLGERAVASLGDRIDPALVCHEEGFADLANAAAADADGPRSLEALAAVDGQEYDPDPPPAMAETPLLYLHTGGTTGDPKVVEISARQVEWNCITEAAAWGLGRDDVAPALLPFYHTGGWLLLTLPLLYVGGRVLLHREFDPGAALVAIEEHGATRVFGVAAIFRAMADHDRFATTDLSSVEWFMSGGGPTPDAVIEAYRERGQRFVLGYGLTEGGPNNCYFPPGRADEAKATESVGRPFPDCEVRIVDADGEPVPAGAVGELEVRGPVTARRYLETEDGTFAGEWVSTGDLARRDEDGDLYVTGRTDNRFVSGGENVSPEAIEDALERHPGVAAAGVVGVPHDRWGTVPKAVVVPADDGDETGEDAGAALDRDDLESFLDERLADYEIPAAFEFVEALPRSGPGKLDRAELEERHGQTDGDEDASGTDR